MVTERRRFRSSPSIGTVTMTRLKYLAYGSNLHPLRLQQRVSSARPVAVVELPGWRLRFHKRGSDGSAKCNVLETCDPADRVHGVVYDIAAREKPALDRAEGLGHGYRLQRLHLQPHGETFFYVATASHIDDALRPFAWYKAYVLEGAWFHGLPTAYTGRIEQVDAIADPQPQRQRDNIRLLWRLSR
jgi:gamma-glutamylcyclotransferase